MTEESKEAQCDREDAHGPHALSVTQMAKTGAWKCPGIKAHPNTMIGRLK